MSPLLAMLLGTATPVHADGVTRFTAFAFPEESVIYRGETVTPRGDTIVQRHCITGAAMPEDLAMRRAADAADCEARVLEDTSERAVSETRCRVDGSRLTLERLDADTVRMTHETLGPGPISRSVTTLHRDGTPCTPEPAPAGGPTIPDIAKPKPDAAACRDGLAELHRMRTSPPPDAPPEAIATIIAGMESGLRQLGCL